MPEIKLTNVTKRWGKFYAVDHLDLNIEDNSFITLLGPSGCGKTTTLRMIAGLETPTSGQIKIGDRVVFDSEAGINVPANKRKVGFLFQNYALWPNMTVYKNIAFGLSNIKEEMNVIDFEAKTIADQLNVLQSPKKLVEITRECYDKKGKLEAEKACLKFIDTYIISMYTAKTILSYKLHEKTDYLQEARKISEALNRKLDTIKASYKQKGKELNDAFEVTTNGKNDVSVRKMHKEEVDLAVRRVARIVKIGMFMDRYPAELSGGQQQRVAIARTLAPEPEVLFMDEPLSNLDAKLRLEMRYELQRLHVETGSTFVYVTHDQMEAMTLATRICLINNGVLQQYEAPLSVYGRPANLFVADFVGNPAINFVDAKGGQKEDGSFLFKVWGNKQITFKPAEEIRMSEWFAQRDQKALATEKARQDLLKDKREVEKGNKDETFKYHIPKVNDDDYGMEEEPEVTNNDFVLGIRPEFINLDVENGIEAEIYGSMPTGMESTVKLNIDNYLVTGVVFGKSQYQIGDKTKLSVAGNEILLYDRKSGQLIGVGSVEL